MDEFNFSEHDICYENFTMCIMGDDILLGSKIDLPYDLRERIGCFMLSRFNYKID